MKDKYLILFKSGKQVELEFHEGAPSLVKTWVTAIQGGKKAGVEAVIQLTDDENEPYAAIMASEIVFIERKMSQ